MEIMKEKFCKTCRQWLPIDDFPKGQNVCKACRAEAYKRKREGERYGFTCEKNCAKYPCFRGIENFTTNFAPMCRDFKSKI